jgi:phosphoribosylanthranilate isomerase
MKPLIKLCGFREIESVHGLSAMEVDMAGFIMAPSKRQVQASQIGRLVSALPKGVKSVGVFINPTIDELEAVFTKTSFDVIQLHGNESAAFCMQIKDAFRVELIKAVHITTTPEEETEFKYNLDTYSGAIDYLLLDTFDRNFAGGTGQAFRWELIPAYRNWCTFNSIKLLVAGGVHAENVDDLMRNWAPHGVDVSSGIETDGHKDIKKMKLFVGKVREHGNCTK